MAFDDAAAYARFMGRFSEPLAGLFADATGVRHGLRALDVGCGPGALTAVLVERLGEGAVSACDPSEPFAAAVRERLPGVAVEVAGAEHLPYADDTFDLVLAQLVVHFLPDPVAGVREMARVARPGGLVAVNVWDREAGPITPVARVVRALDPDSTEATSRPGSAEGDLGSILEGAGLRDVTESALTVETAFADVEEWWTPFTLGVGPLGEYLADLAPAARERIRDRCAADLPEGPFTLTARAWTATGRA